MNRLLRTALALSLVLLGAACGTARTINLHMRGEANLHKNSNGDPTPVMVWVLQVKEAGSFESAGFDDLTFAPKDVLGDGCIVVKEVEIADGMQNAIQVPVRVADTTKFPFIGLVGQYRRKEGDDWRKLLELSETSSDPGIILSGYGMRLVEQEEAEALPDADIEGGEAPASESSGDEAAGGGS